MSQPTAKNKTVESKKLKLIAKRPRKIKLALKSWFEASDKVDSDPLELNGAPPWVENAWAEVVKVLLPGNRLPTVGEWDMELLGEFMGRLQAFGKLHVGEIPMGPKVQAENDRFQKFEASQPQSPERTAKEKVLARDLRARVAAVQESIPDVMKAAFGSSHADSEKYQRGLARGLKLSPDELITANVFERHTRTFWALANYWRVWVKCKSVREIYNHLCKAVGSKEIGSYKTFEIHVVKKIGLKVRGRGRPAG